MEVELRKLSKAYGPHRVVQDLTVGLNKGEMVALLGPSGCGKTTTLRMVAGFIQPTTGQILFKGVDVTRMPPHKRDTGLVFQSYALFPHLTVAENIAFGLKRRAIATDARELRINEMVSMLRLDGLERRLPRELSGGQQQRVAVARALVINPSILLLDEPFSNLDARLRESTGVELKRIQQALGITAIFVTHDQQEAMAIANRIAVMNDGRVEQLASATEIYERPATRFVAEFIGKANFLPATIEDVAGEGVRLSYGSGAHGLISVLGQTLPDGKNVTMMVRPERIRLTDNHDSEPTMSVAVEAVIPQGAFAHVSARLATGESLMIQIPGHKAGYLQVGETISVAFDPMGVVLFPR